MKKLFIFIGIVALSFSNVRAFTDSQIADAIFHTENSKSHPYGIMIKCKNPRQVCLNTIHHARQRWNGKGDFIVFLGKTYSPPEINPNWVRLVKFFLKRG